MTLSVIGEPISKKSELHSSKRRRLNDEGLEGSTTGTTTSSTPYLPDAPSQTSASSQRFLIDKTDKARLRAARKEAKRLKRLRRKQRKLALSSAKSKTAPSPSSSAALQSSGTVSTTTYAFSCQAPSQSGLDPPPSPSPEASAPPESASASRPVTTSWHPPLHSSSLVQDGPKPIEKPRKRKVHDPPPPTLSALFPTPPPSDPPQSGSPDTLADVDDFLLIDAQDNEFVILNRKDEPLPPSSALCQITEIPGKGKGLQTTLNITAGQTIIRESPFIRFKHPIVPDELRGVYRQLKPEKRKLFRSFTATAPNIDDKLVRIAETNAIPLQSERSKELSSADADEEAGQDSGMFELICRVNHACIPNTCWSWNGRRRELSLLALKDIPCNTEITACYLSESFNRRADRQEELSTDFGFICTCEACGKDPAQTLEDELVIQHVVFLLERWEGPTITWAKDDASALRDITSALDIMHRQGRVEGQGGILEALFQLHAAWGRREEAIDAAKRVLNLYRLTNGKDAAERSVYSHFVQQPELADDWMVCVPRAAPRRVVEDDLVEEDLEFEEDEEDGDFEADASDSDHSGTDGDDDHQTRRLYRTRRRHRFW